MEINPTTALSPLFCPGLDLVASHGRDAPSLLGEKKRVMKSF